MPIGNVDYNSDRNYSDILNSAGKDPVEDLSKKYGITYDNGEKGSMTVKDFFQLMITQLTNQDFMNPTSDSEYMAQLTQYSSLQAMQEMAQYTQQNYAMSMIGKEVSAAKYSNGKLISETGPVQKLLINDGEYEVQINGKSFKLSHIHAVGDGAGSSDENKGTGSTEDKPTTPSDPPSGSGSTSGSTSGSGSSSGSAAGAPLG